MKKIFFTFLLLLTTSTFAHAQQFNTQEVPYADIEKVFICYAEENFEFRQHQPEEILGRNYRHIPLPFDRAFVTLSDVAGREPIKISYPQDPEVHAPYYTYNFIANPHAKLYLAIQHRAQVVASCDGRDERTNTVFIIKDIPARSTLFITYKKIVSMEIPGFNPGADQVEGGVNFGPIPNREIEPARNNGINIPELPSHGIFIPQAQNPEAAPAPAEEVSGNSENPAENPIENPVVNAPKIEVPAKPFNPQPEVASSANDSDYSAVGQLKDNSSGCSLQKNSSVNSGMEIMVATFLLGLFLLRIKTKHC